MTINTAFDMNQEVYFFDQGTNVQKSKIKEINFVKNIHEEAIYYHVYDYCTALKEDELFEDRVDIIQYWCDKQLQMLNEKYDAE